MKDIEYKSYEEAKKRLEEISEILRGNNVTLDKSLELYEESAKLIAFCFDKLQKAQLKFTELNASVSEE